MSTEKRPPTPDNSGEVDSEEWIGPMPAEAATPKPKKRKGIVFIQNFKL